MAPILTMLVTKDGGETERFAGKISRPWNALMDAICTGYVFVLKASLRKRWLVFTTAITLFALALILLNFQGMELLPQDVEQAVSRIVAPQGYTISMSGENKDMAESRAELTGAMGIAAMAIYLLLVAQFRSFAHPITVLTSVPLSLIGVSIALWIAGKPVSMPVLIGFILLMGIVVNNAIILIDFIQQRRATGMARREAIVQSVATRFRPIMMTSLSTMAGMIPLAMEWALGAERFSPLAIAVIGGMAVSTLLTMIVIPVLYDFLDDLGQRRNETATPDV